MLLLKEKIWKIYMDVGSAACAAKEWQIAGVMFEESVDFAKRLSPSNAHLAISLDNLALVYRETGRACDSGPLLKKALSYYEKEPGKYASRIASNLHHLADLNFSRSRYTTAAWLYRRVLKSYESLLGCEHELISTILLRLSWIDHQRGRNDDALNFYKRAMAIRSKNDPNVA